MPIAYSSVAQRYPRVRGPLTESPRSWGWSLRVVLGPQPSSTVCRMKEWGGVPMWGATATRLRCCKGSGWTWGQPRPQGRSQANPGCFSQVLSPLTPYSLLSISGLAGFVGFRARWGREEPIPCKQHSQKSQNKDGDVQGPGCMQ